MPAPLLADLGGPEILIILVVVILLFGAKKLPEIARGSGQALRIFKEETKALREDDRPAAAPGTKPVEGPTEPGKPAPQ